MPKDCWAAGARCWCQLLWRISTPSNGLFWLCTGDWLLAREFCLWSDKTSWFSRTDETLQNSEGLLQPAVFPTEWEDSAMLWLASKSPLGNNPLQFIPSELCFGEMNELNRYLLMHVTYWVGFSQPSFFKIVNVKGKSILKSLKALKMTFTCCKHNPSIICFVLGR